MMILRVRKSDSAHLYRLLESYEGVAGYSTLPGEKNFPWRDVQIHYAPDQLPELRAMIRNIRAEVPLEILEGVDLLDA
ncbi:MAG: hypothetical protein HUU37_01100 [Bdellovibrionales bacterium]|nr:hypothetical protein [Bdellovibrionales bacterium]